MYGLVNNITGIKIIGTDGTDTFITDLNPKLKYSDEISSSTINTKYRNLYRNLSNNTFERVILEQATDITKSEPTPRILSPEYILIPTVESARTHSITIEVDTALYSVVSWYFNNISSLQLTISAGAQNYPAVSKNDGLYNQIKFQLMSKNYSRLSPTSQPEFCFRVITRKMEVYLLKIPINTE